MRRFVAAAATSGGSPSRSAPTTSVTLVRPFQLRERRGLRAPPARPCGRAAPRRASRARPARRRSRPSRRAPPCRRTGRPFPGPSATLPAPNASAERSTVPTLPGSLTPHSATQTGPAGRRRPALRVDGERARARAELGDLPQQVRRDLLARRAPSRPRTAAAPAASPPRRAASIRSSPSATNVRVLSRHLRPASFRTCLSCSLWGLVIGIETKKGARPSRRGAR